MNAKALKSLLFNSFLLSIIFIIAGISAIVSYEFYKILLIGILFLIITIVLFIMKKV